jgi:hypothetical protein
MARPDIATPEGRRAYGAELRRFALGWRIAGLGLLALGAVGMVVTARADAPWLEGWLGPSTIAAIALGWLCCFVAIAKRTRYHKRRMAEGG